MKKLLKYIGVGFGIALFCAPSYAEQDLPITISEGSTLYRSQLNYVEALDENSGRVFLETVVYQDIEPMFYIPWLEKDVQWIVIKELKIEGPNIRATDSKKRVYFLNKNTGRVERK